MQLKKWVRYAYPKLISTSTFIHFKQHLLIKVIISAHKFENKTCYANVSRDISRLWRKKKKKRKETNQYFSSFRKIWLWWFLPKKKVLNPFSRSFSHGMKLKLNILETKKFKSDKNTKAAHENINWYIKMPTLPAYAFKYSKKRNITQCPL